MCLNLSISFHHQLFWTLGPQQQLGQLTSYHDASMIYGSSSLEHQTLRDFEMPSESLIHDCRMVIPSHTHPSYICTSFLHPKCLAWFPECFNYLASINMDLVFVPCRLVLFTSAAISYYWPPTVCMFICLSMGLRVHDPDLPPNVQDSDSPSSYFFTM